MRVVDFELTRIDWHELREASGFATDMPDALRSMLAASTPDDVERAYWRLENHAVVQGQLFQAAEYVVPVLIAALLEENFRFVKFGIFELLFQILHGVPHESEISLGNEGLADRCRERAREGLWILYWHFLKGEPNIKDAVREVVELIEPDQSRLNAYLNPTVLVN